MATFQFKGLAKLWWKSQKNTRGGVEMGLKAFEELFLGQYFPLIERRKKKQEFMELKQLTTSVIEYEVKFTALSRFAPSSVAFEAEKCEYFQAGLRTAIQDGLSHKAYINYAKLVVATQNVENQRE